MIAVFTRYQRDFDENKYFPKKNFVRITKPSDIGGKRFTGVIIGFKFYENRDVEDAYEYLHAIQPELFKT